MASWKLEQVRLNSKLFKLLDHRQLELSTLKLVVSITNSGLFNCSRGTASRACEVEQLAVQVA